jgi:hypothetical protein
MWRFIRWRKTASNASELIRLERLKRLLTAAARIPGYAEGIRAAGLDDKARVARLGSVEEALDRIPYTCASRLELHPGLFRDPLATTKAEKLRKYFHAVEPSPRIAVLTGGYLQSNQVRCFTSLDDPGLVEFRPQVLAAELSQWRELLQAQRETGTPIMAGQLEHAVIVLTNPVNQHLASAEREQLWRSFRVPVLEVLRGMSGELVGWECEAREGLHLESESAVFETAAGGALQGRLAYTGLSREGVVCLRVVTSLRGKVEDSPCGCGRQSHRLVLDDEQIQNQEEGEAQAILEQRQQVAGIRINLAPAAAGAQ